MASPSPTTAYTAAPLKSAPPELAPDKQPARPISAAAIREKVKTPAELALKLRDEPDADERGKIVEQLWELGTPEAVEVLRQRFQIEREADVKADIVAGLGDAKSPGTREVRLGLLVAALAPTQPSEVRLTAVEMLADFEDQRAVALLQNLAHDPSEEIRDAAKEVIEARAAKAEKP